MDPNRSSCVGRQASLLGQIGLLTLLAISCQSTVSYVGDHYYEAGRYLDAEAAYVDYLDSSSADPEASSRALYRLGVIYATSESAVHDLYRAIEILERLVATYPESTYAVEAELLLDLMLAAGDLDLELQSLRSQLGVLEAELAARQTDLYLLQKQLGVKEGQLGELQNRLPPLEAQIEELTRQVEAKELELEQLDRLKAIDLESPPPRKRR